MNYTKIVLIGTYIFNFSVSLLLGEIYDENTLWYYTALSYTNDIISCYSPLQIKVWDYTDSPCGHQVASTVIGLRSKPWFAHRLV